MHTAFWELSPTRLLADARDKDDRVSVHRLLCTLLLKHSRTHSLIHDVSTTAFAYLHIPWASVFMMYSSEQLSRYFEHIGLPPPSAKPGSLEYLTELVKLQLATVPFEDLSLHYSKHRLLSLDTNDLFDKVVSRGRGGSHMVNLVTIENQRYLVDVGFGSKGPSLPIPLISGYECTGIAPLGLKLEYKSLPKHTDPSQRVWVYSHRECDTALWVDAYSFIEIEFFPEDYEVMNLSTMVLPQSFFTQTVLCVKALLNAESGNLEGVLYLHQDEVRRRLGEETCLVEKLKTEEERTKALEKLFGIIITEEEKQGIRDLATELRGHQ
ncbi:MAG: N-terminal acetyltransferase [Trichoglossum hirsutum]|nr:MAG: N-terminal acetyltransferase [Trichoglossum hirsutum]